MLLYIRKIGDHIHITNDDGTVTTAYKNGINFWVPPTASTGGGTTDPGTGGGTGGSTNPNMPGCQLDYPNGQAPLSCLINWRGSRFSPSYFIKIVPAVLEYEQGGNTINITEGYRPLGVEADRAIGASDTSANEDLAHTTSTQSSNQWYQKGREDNGSTPNAATPGTSNHGRYLVGASDAFPSDQGRRDFVFQRYGLAQDVPGEQWHWSGAGTASVTLPSLAEAMQMAGI
jgi:hypothetical protein